MDGRVAVFFAGQDAAEAGRAEEADELFAIAAAQAPIPGDDSDSDDHNTATGSMPPEPIVRSMALNGQAELMIDRAISGGFPLRSTSAIPPGAARLLDQAIKLLPCNATALMNRAMLARDEGDAARAIECWAAAARGVTHNKALLDQPWCEDWLCEPQRRCAALACNYSALLLSQLGRHDEASKPLRRLGFKWRLAPVVWELASSAASSQGAESSSLKLVDPKPHDLEGDALAVRLYQDAIPKGTLTALRRAFCPDAAYWRETRYETAAAAKSYFTFYVDLDRLRERYDHTHVQPSGDFTNAMGADAIERLLLHLLPLTGRADELRSCEWWVHQRASGRGFGHELHYDLEEHTMETSGRILHPTISSVVYLAAPPGGQGDPTLVLDETMDAPLTATRAFCAPPVAGSFFTFRGDLLHGVLPGAFHHRDGRSSGMKRPRSGDRGVGGGSVRSSGGVRSSGSANQSEQRLTLLVAWYSEPLGGGGRRGGGRHGGRLAAKSSVPRASRSTTWPNDLCMSEAEKRLDEVATGRAPAAAGLRRVPVPQVTSQVWVRVDEGAPGGHGSSEDEPRLEVPPSMLRQHFFLQQPTEVGDRLKEEHGVGGSWATRAGNDTTVARQKRNEAA